MEIYHQRHNELFLWMFDAIEDRVHSGSNDGIKNVSDQTGGLFYLNEMCDVFVQIRDSKDEGEARLVMKTKLDKYHPEMMTAFSHELAISYGAFRSQKYK